MLAKQTSARLCWLSGPTAGLVSSYTIFGLIEIWFYFLACRDVKVRYKQTALGAVWATLQPVLTMIVFTFLFGRLARVSSEGQPYAIFSHAGLLPWNFFAAAVTSSSKSLVNRTNLITKVYFPRVKTRHWPAMDRVRSSGRGGVLKVDNC